MADERPDLTIIKGGEVEPPLRVRHHKKRWCAHAHVVLHMNSRRVYCADCDDEIDPFTALNNFANAYESHLAAIGRVKSELKHYSDALRDVRRQLRNDKATLRRRSR